MRIKPKAAAAPSPFPSLIYVSHLEAAFAMLSKQGLILSIAYGEADKLGLHYTAIVFNQREKIFFDKPCRGTSINEAVALAIAYSNKLGWFKI